MMEPVRIRALKRAIEKIGVKEHGGNNRGRIIDGWNRMAGVPIGSPWCMSFVHAMFQLEGRTLGGWASVGFFEDWARKQGFLVTRPLRGDLVCYRWGADDWPDHVGFVERVLAVRWFGGSFVGWVQTVEGNTSSGIRGSQDDGDGVYRRRRWISRAKFVRVV